MSITEKTESGPNLLSITGHRKIRQSIIVLTFSMCKDRKYRKHTHTQHALINLTNQERTQKIWNNVQTYRVGDADANDLDTDISDQTHFPLNRWLTIGFAVGDQNDYVRHTCSVSVGRAEYMRPGHSQSVGHFRASAPKRNISDGVREWRGVGEVGQVEIQRRCTTWTYKFHATIS